jgi:hypothetical protein
MENGVIVYILKEYLIEYMLSNHDFNYSYLGKILKNNFYYLTFYKYNFFPSKELKYITS